MEYHSAFGPVSKGCLCGRFQSCLTRYERPRDTNNSHANTDSNIPSGSDMILHTPRWTSDSSTLLPRPSSLNLPFDSGFVRTGPDTSGFSSSSHIGSDGPSFSGRPPSTPAFAHQVGSSRSMNSSHSQFCPTTWNSSSSDCLEAGYDSNSRPNYALPMSSQVLESRNFRQHYSECQVPGSRNMRSFSPMAAPEPVPEGGDSAPYTPPTTPAEAHPALRRAKLVILAAPAPSCLNHQDGDHYACHGKGEGYRLCRERIPTPYPRNRLAGSLGDGEDDTCNSQDDDDYDNLSKRQSWLSNISSDATSETEADEPKMIKSSPEPLIQMPAQLLISQKKCVKRLIKKTHPGVGTGKDEDEVSEGD